MAEIKINLTGQQEHYLKLFAQNHFPEAKDNLCTVNPIHLVQTQRQRVCDPDYGDVDEIRYIVPDWDYAKYDTPQELVEAYYEDHYEGCSIEIVSYDEAYKMDRFTDINGEEQIILNVEDYLEAYGINKDLYFVGYLENYYETVAYFFILEEAKKYLDYQGHNLTNPRTYTVGAGYANKGEYHHFWELLFNIGKQLNEQGDTKGSGSDDKTSLREMSEV